MNLAVSIHHYAVLKEQLLFSQWLETEFLQYLEEWESAVQNREGVTPAQRKSMLLSVETLTGLKLTGMQTHIYLHIVLCVHTYIYVRTKFTIIITHTCTYFDPQ